MGLFRTKEEKRIEAEMKREEQLRSFNERIESLKAKREEMARLAAEAELSGDDATRDTAINGLCSLNDMISSLQQTKSNFDMINITNAIAIDMSTASSLLAEMASGKTEIPNIRKVQKTSAKLATYMRRVQISQKAMGNMLKSSNPANRARTAAELDSVRPMIDAAREKIIQAKGLPTSGGVTATSEIDELLKKIDADKNKLI